MNCDCSIIRNSSVEARKLLRLFSFKGCSSDGTSRQPSYSINSAIFLSISRFLVRHFITNHHRGNLLEIHDSKIPWLIVDVYLCSAYVLPTLYMLILGLAGCIHSSFLHRILYLISSLTCLAISNASCLDFLENTFMYATKVFLPPLGCGIF